jgi:DNA-binding transcriptional MerR regulator
MHEARFRGKSQAAREVPCSEGSLLRYEKIGIIAPERDSAGRRLFTSEDIEKIREYRASRRPHATK